MKTIRNIKISSVPSSPSLILFTVSVVVGPGVVIVTVTTVVILGFVVEGTPGPEPLGLLRREGCHEFPFSTLITTVFLPRLTD